MRHILSLDLGATKCAAGIIEHQADSNTYICLRDTQVKLTETSSLTDLIRQLENRLNVKARDLDAVCVGAAGQFNGQELIHLAGVYPYSMPFAKVAAKEEWPSYRVLHDYDTVMCATFTSYMADTANVLYLRQPTNSPYKRRVTLGLGTGVGLKDGILFPDGNFWLGKNEMGHIGISHPPTASADTLRLHRELLQYLRKQESIAAHQPVTFENVLTGRGLVHIHNFLYHDHVDNGAEVGDKLASNHASELMDAFAWYLGLFIGTVELSFMPESGTWITGGVALKNPGVFDNPNLTTGIEASPAYLQERSAYPLGVLLNPQHALIGGGYYAMNKLLQERKNHSSLDVSSMIP